MDLEKKEQKSTNTFSNIKEKLNQMEEELNSLRIPDVENVEEKKENTVDESEGKIQGKQGKTEETPSVESKEDTSYNANKKDAAQKNNSDSTSEHHLENPPSGKKKRSHWFRNIFLFLLFLLLLAYGAASYFFLSHFFLHTTIWGQDCSYKSVDEVKQLVRSSIDTYQIRLFERDNQSETLTAKQLGLDLLEDGTIEDLLDSQRYYAWITFLWKEYDYQKSVNLNLSDDKLAENISALKAEQAENIIAPADAYYQYDSKEKKYVIVPEVYGNTIDSTVLAAGLKDAILSKAETFSLEEMNCYVNPKILQDDEDIVKESSALNAYMATRIEYDFADRKEIIDADLLKDWVSLNKKQKAVLDKSKVKEYVTMLAERYNTLGRERNFKSIAGNSITVSGGSYGWKIDEDKEYKKLVSLIKKHKQTTREPIYSHEAKSRKKNDLGKTYVEIDLSKQHLWYYKNGETIVSTPVVTGDVTKGRGTPTGVYYILYKQTDHVLRGPGYASHVDFWMPFIEDRGIGIHDSSWRGSYGGSIYRGNGSHGCVNTPRSAVSEIFYSIESNCPVVVHW